MQIFRFYYATFALQIFARTSTLNFCRRSEPPMLLLLCKDFELMQSLAITTLDSADGPNLLCYFCFARNIGLATGGDRYKILLLNFEAAGYP